MMFNNRTKSSIAARLLLSVPAVMLSFASQSAEPVGKPVTTIKNHLTLVQDTVLTKVEVAPSPVGGFQNFYNYIGRNFKYPKAAVTAQVEGRVIVQFVVEKDGSLVDIKALKDLGFGTGEEAVRMLKSAPKWNPGIMDGKPVRVQYTLPIQLHKAKAKEKQRPKSTFR